MVFIIYCIFIIFTYFFHNITYFSKKSIALLLFLFCFSFAMCLRFPVVWKSPRLQAHQAIAFRKQNLVKSGFYHSSNFYSISFKTLFYGLKTLMLNFSQILTSKLSLHVFSSKLESVTGWGFFSLLSHTKICGKLLLFCRKNEMRALVNKQLNGLTPDWKMAEKEEN